MFQHRNGPEKVWFKGKDRDSWGEFFSESLTTLSLLLTIFGGAELCWTSSGEMPRGDDVGVEPDTSFGSSRPDSKKRLPAQRHYQNAGPDRLLQAPP